MAKRVQSMMVHVLQKRLAAEQLEVSGHDRGSDCDVNEYLGGDDPASEPPDGNDDPQPSVLHERLVHDSDNETLHVCTDCIDSLDDELDLGAGCLSVAS